MKIFKKTFSIVCMLVGLLLIFGLNGCEEADVVNNNIQRDADNFHVTRRVVALNTRTSEALFSVDGKISISDDEDGDLNVTIKTGDDSYQLFYAHLSQDVTYTCVQLNESNVSPYAYKITYFPVRDVIENGLIDINSADDGSQEHGE